MQQNPSIQTALVSTNSITQGEQVGILWSHLLAKGVKINFAHQTFRWTNDAKGKAAVHCVIIGFALFDKSTKWLYSYADINGDGTETEVRDINPYLVDGPNILIESRTKPLCYAPKMVWGNKPVDGGHLILSDLEKAELLHNEPGANKFIKRLVGAKEFIRNESRWCLWLVDTEPNELKAMPRVMERIERVRQERLSSVDKGARELASRPSQFRDINNPESYILIPAHSSENRDYIPLGFLGKNEISHNSCQTVPNATLYHFGVLTSKMHMTWVRYTCGRLKSDYRYSKDIVYNNFPWPGCGTDAAELSGEAKTKIETAAQAVLDARAQFPNSSLADLYDPRTMPPVLVKAHQALDRAVDAAYSYRDTGSDAERIAFLFSLYGALTHKE